MIEFALVASLKPFVFCLGVSRNCGIKEWHKEIMATVVLVGLIHMICEMLIDDLSFFGDTNIEFI